MLKITEKLKQDAQQIEIDSKLEDILSLCRLINRETDLCAFFRYTGISDHITVQIAASKDDYNNWLLDETRNLNSRFAMRWLNELEAAINSVVDNNYAKEHSLDPKGKGVYHG